MDDKTKVETTGTTPEEKKETPTETPETPHDPLKIELDKVKSKTEGKTELEKLLFTEKKIQERKAELLKEQGTEIPTTSEDDDKPLTISEYRKLEQEKAQKTALSLADEIQNEVERELTKYHINNSIKPTGNPAEDLRLARAIVNSVKNAQIATEVARKTTASPNGTGSGNPGKHEDVFEPTPEEASMMRPPFNLTKDDIIKARQKAKK